MNIGTIGSGMIGGTAAQLFVRSGHEVAISNSRGPASLASLVEDLGSKAHAATIDEASSFGEVVLVAIPFRKYQTLPGKPLAGKMYYETLATQGRLDVPVEDRLALYVAGDDAKAKGVVSRLIEEIGLAPIDTGSPHDGGRRQQPGSPIYNRPMTAREARTVLGGQR